MATKAWCIAIALATIASGPARAQAIQSGTFRMAGPQLIYENLEGAVRDVMVTVCNQSGDPAPGQPMFVNFPGHSGSTRQQINVGSCVTALFTSKNGDTVVLNGGGKTESGTYSIAFR